MSLILAIAAYLPVWHTAQEVGSLFWCHEVVSLQFTHVRYFACRCRLQSLWVDCSIVTLHCVTLTKTWQQIFKGSVTVVGILPDVTVERRHVWQICAELCPHAPFVTPLRSRGHFRYDVERAKRFVNVHLHYIISNMAKIRKISSFPLLEKFLRTPMLVTWSCFKILAFFRRDLVVSYLQIQQRKNLWIIEILINYYSTLQYSKFRDLKPSKPRRDLKPLRPRLAKNGSRDESRDRDQVSRLHHWEVTHGVSDSWATCPTLLRGIWARSRRTGFCCWSWLSAHS